MLDTIKEVFEENKKIMIYIGGGIVGLFILILIISLIARLTVKTYGSYEEIEIKISEAAEKYYKDHPEFLPNTIGTTAVVNIQSLSSNEYIKPLNELLKDGDKCSAQAVATKLSTGYDYSAYLDCGDAYTSNELYKKILEDNQLVTDGVGLYSINSRYVFRGEVKNNYVKLNEQLWRIVKIDENNNVVLISEFKTPVQVWDNRYNEEVQKTDGINDYNVSRIKDTLESIFYGEELLTKGEKSKVVSDKLCIAPRGLEETSDIYSTECKVLSESESPIGMLTVGEYIQASIDENCKTVFDRACINYNYLNDYASTVWTITPAVKNSAYVYNITTSGVVESRANSTKQVRYVIKLGTKAFHKSGSGIETDPYVIR